MCEGRAIAGAYDINIACGSLLSDVSDNIGNIVAFVGVAHAIKFGPRTLVCVFGTRVPSSLALRINPDVSRGVDARPTGQAVNGSSRTVKEEDNGAGAEHVGTGRGDVELDLAAGSGAVLADNICD